MSQVLSVSEVVFQIKHLLENHYPFRHISCSGELSNISSYKSGHVYFSLKDNSAKINCVIYAGAFKNQKIKLTEGLKVIVCGSINLYAPNGNLQLVAYEIKEIGFGNLYQQFEALKKKLYLDGYFDESHKKPIPKYPMKIGVIAGEASAALADIQKTLASRWPLAEVLIKTCLVQGNLASRQIIETLKAVDSLGCDVIILGRGGGSIEDLWAFNDEELVKTIYALDTPIVTGVGHEIDTTLVDYAADVRGLTPTDAAMKATPNINEVLQDLDHLTIRLNRAIHQKHLSCVQKQQFIHQNLLHQMNSFQSRLNQYHLVITKLRHVNTLLGTQMKSRIETLRNKMVYSLENKLKQEQQKLALITQHFQLNSPITILNKGYTLTYQEGKLITKASQLDNSKKVKIRYSDAIVEVN